MSLSASMSNALSGLTVTARGAEVVSSNLANALNPNYAARELSQSARIHAGNGGGVQVKSIDRLVPLTILADSRIAQATYARSGTMAAYFGTIEASIGSSSDTSSLTGLISAFDASLAAAASSPNNEIRLQQTLDAANGVAAKFNGIAKDIQSARTEAERTIESDVKRLNSGLAEVARLNRLVTISQSRGDDASSLLDARQKVINDISDIVPLKEIPRGGGQVALFSQGGATLLDGSKPAEISFSAVRHVTDQMSLEGGQLSVLTLDGETMSPTQMTFFRGGSLEANFIIRDRTAPSLQHQLDELAVDFYERLSSSSVDPSISPPAPGLFTDAQSSFDPANQLGFASRIAVNNVADPKAGGELWRLRSGLYATTPGPVGDSNLFNNLRTALSSQSTIINGGGANAFVLASNLTSRVSSDRVSADVTAEHDRAYSETMTSALLGHGVDSDKEFQNLVQLEQAYAANAKVIQAVTEMLDSLLRLT